MIIYQALSTYQILECIEHRCLFHKDEKCVILLGDYIKERFSNYKDISEFFDEFYLFKYGGYGGNREQILQAVEAEYNATIPYPLTENLEFYIAGIHTYLQMLMLDKEIPFAMFEDGSGALSRPWILAEIAKKNSPEKYELINSYGLYYHENRLITKKYCDMSAQFEGFKDDKAVDFNVLNGFRQLPLEIQYKILSFFGIEDKLNVGEDVTLVLTQQFAGLGQLTFEEHVSIYQGLLDFYFSKDKIVFKLHPDDIMYYERLFPDINIIRKKFPSELIPFSFENIPKKLVTISSTGTNLIASHFSQVIKFNELYEHSYRYNFIYYVLLNLLCCVGIEEVGVSGANFTQLYNLIVCNSQFHVTLRDKNCVVMVYDDLTEDLINLNKIISQYVKDGEIQTIIFLNSKESYNFFSPETAHLWDDLIPITVRKRLVRNEDNYEDAGEHVIYILTKDSNMRLKCEGFCMEKDLKHTGISISVEQETRDKRYIRMLEGRLEATEKRLTEYIENEKKLLERLSIYEK